MARGILLAASRLCPPERRGAWLEEWEGELWALHARGVGGLGLIRFGLDGAVDAVRLTILTRGRGGGDMGTGWLHDLRMAARRLVRAPGFALVTVAVLALGIGANTALFGALRAALLQPPPYPEPERLVVVDLLLGLPGEVPDTLPWSWPKFEATREAMAGLEQVAGYMAFDATLSGVGDPARVGLELVSPAYFALLGAEPAAGRLLLPEEAPPAAPRVVVLTWDTWRTRFGGDPGIVGRSVVLDGERFEVVGVAPDSFRGLTGPEFGWVSIADAPVIIEPQRLERQWSHWFRVVARVERDAGIDATDRMAETTGTTLTVAFPHPRGEPVGHGVALTPLVQARVNPTARLAVAAAGTGAILLLLIAAANAAGLFLARMTARAGDVAVRAALGAGRARLAREVLAESLLLSVAGGVAGVALALSGQGAVRWAASYALDTSGSRGLQFLDPATLGVDGTVLAAGLGLALVTGIAFGLAPARAAGRTGLTDDLRAAGRRSASTGRRSGGAWRARGVLVAGQLGLTLVLLSGAGLMLTSFARLDAVALGFDPEDVLTARYGLGPGVSPDEIRAFDARLVEALEALPGVERAAVGVCAPLAGLCDIAGLRQVDDRADLESFDGEWIHTQAVSPGFFETARTPVLRGQGLPTGLHPDDPPVVVLNRSAAEAWFPGQDPVGHRLGVTSSVTPEGRPAEIVGVVEDVLYQELEEGPFPTAYFSAEQAPAGWGQILVRTAGEPMALVGDVRRTVASLRPGLPIHDVTTLEARKAAATARTRVILGLLAAFGVTALLMSAVGLWGLVSYGVSRRTREMGLRMALGADRGHVLRKVVAGPILLALCGAAAGIVAAIWLNGHLAALLFEVEPGAPGVLAAAAAILVAVAAAAAVLPARRATRIDPSEALRSE